MRALAALALLALALASPSLAHADDTSARTRGRRPVQHGDVIHVPGRPQQPYAFALGGRSAVDASRPEPAAHFVAPVVTAVRRAPF